jgi:hypothetical protein
MQTEGRLTSRDSPQRRALREVDAIQNPALGAFLLWRCCREYRDSAKGMPLLLSFLVLPLLLHRKTLDTVNSTLKSSGLPLFAAKLGELQEELLAVHTRATVLRELGLSSIAFGVQSRMVVVDYARAELRALPIEKKPFIPERLKPLVRGAERVGIWFSNLDVNQIASLLRVEF